MKENKFFKNHYEEFEILLKWLKLSKKIGEEYTNNPNLYVQDLGGAINFVKENCMNDVFFVGSFYIWNCYSEIVHLIQCLSDSLAGIKSLYSIAYKNIKKVIKSDCKINANNI